MKRGHHYAWQVIAYWNDIEMGKTEVWEFEVDKSKSTASKSESPTYRMVKKQMAGTYYTFSDHLYFAYDNKANDANLSYTIYTKGEQSKSLKELPEIPLESGRNQLQIDIKKILNLIKGQSYILKITDRYGFEYFLAFKIVKK